jgi:hypothetical protein
VIQLIVIAVPGLAIAVVGGLPSFAALIVVSLVLCVFLLWPRRLVGVPSPTPQAFPGSSPSGAYTVTAEPFFVVQREDPNTALTHTETYELTIEQGRTHVWVRRRTEIPNASPQLVGRLLGPSGRLELPST